MRTEAVRNEESVSKPLPDTPEAKVPERGTKPPSKVTVNSGPGRCHRHKKTGMAALLAKLIAEAKGEAAK